MKSKKSFKKLAVLLGAVLVCLLLAFSACAGTNLPQREPSGTPTAPTEQPEKPEQGENPEQGETPEKPEDPEQPEQSEEWKSEYGLPDADGAMARLVQIYGGSNKIFLLQKNKIARMPCPKGETVTLNMTYEVSGYAKLVLDDSIAEFNEVFSVINPQYKFAINYAPAEEDFNNKFSVRMRCAENLSASNTGEVFGLAHISYYNNFTELGDFGITIKNEVLTNGSYLMTTFKHELMHLLGAGDAYNNPSATKATVMQSYTLGGYRHFSNTDIAFLDALYRNPAFEGSSLIDEYAASYEENTAHTESNLTARAYAMLADGINAEEVLEQAEQLGYADLTEFCAATENGFERDRTFGSVSAAFTEIEYTVRPSATYFGSIDPVCGKYWHGRQTTVGSSQGIGYRDYGGGILYAAPNGNEYTLIMRVGKFVVLFRLSGSFRDFPNLALTLWHVCK